MTRLRERALEAFEKSFSDNEVFIIPTGIDVGRPRRRAGKIPARHVDWFSGLEDVARTDRNVRRNRRQVGEQFRFILHHLQDVLRLDVLVDVER